MSFHIRLLIPGRRLRMTALAASILLILISGAFTAWWSARARSQELTESTLTGEHKGPARPETAPPGEAIDAPTTEPTASSPASVAVTAQPDARQSSFTITWDRTETSADGQESRLLRTTTRYQRSDGVYKLVQTYPAREGDAGLVATYFGYVGLGLFRLDEAGGRLIFHAPQGEERPADVDAYLRSDPRFDREEVVQGQRALVLRTPGGDRAAYTEEYRAPALDGLLVKSVDHSPLRREVWEPTSIELGEPAASLFAGLERYRPDYTYYERTIKKTERDPQRRTEAQIMRELLGRMRAVRPDAR